MPEARGMLGADERRDVVVIVDAGGDGRGHERGDGGGGDLAWPDGAGGAARTRHRRRLAHQPSLLTRGGQVASRAMRGWIPPACAAALAAVLLEGCGGGPAEPSSQPAPTPSETTAAGWDASIPPASESADWLRSVVADELDDTYGASVRVTNTLCVNTTHGSAKCAVEYVDESGRNRARFVVHYYQGRPTYDLVDDRPAG